MCGFTAPGDDVGSHSILLTFIGIAEGHCIICNAILHDAIRI